MLRSLFLLLSATALALATSQTRPEHAPQKMVRSSEPGTEQQKLDCYDRTGQSGSNIRFTDYVANLASTGFDNKISSCCFDGIWLLYDKTNFNENSFNSGVYYAWGENYCSNVDSSMDNRASSVRFTGAPNGYKYNTINFYEEHYFMGDEQFAYEDIPTFGKDNFGRSAIVTGCLPWTLYEYDNYQGQSVCLFPSDANNCYPSFFETESDMGGLANRVSSARQGCFSKRKVIGKAAKRTENGQHEAVFVPEQ